jgi:hypothetical protein
VSGNDRKREALATGVAAPDDCEAVALWLLDVAAAVRHNETGDGSRPCEIEAYSGHVSDRTIPDISPTFGDLRGRY